MIADKVLRSTNCSALSSHTSREDTEEAFVRLRTEAAELQNELALSVPRPKRFLAFYAFSCDENTWPKST